MSDEPVLTLSDLVATEAALRMRGEHKAAKGMSVLIDFVLKDPERRKRIIVDLPIGKEHRSQK